MGNPIKNIYDDFSMVALLIIPIGVAINCISGQLTAFFKLPVYLDAIGTILVSILCGSWVGCITALLSNIVSSIINPSMFPFLIVNVSLALITGYLSKKNMFKKWYKCIFSMICMSLVSIVVSAPIVVLMYGGITGGGSSLFTALVMTTGTDIWTAFYSTDGFFTLIDRIISFAIFWKVVKCIPPRILIKFMYGYNFI